MDRKNIKIVFLISFPFFVFLIAAGLLAATAPDFFKSSPIDVIGIVASKKISAQAAYRLSFSENAQGKLAPEGKLFIRFSGPAEGTVKILIPKAAHVFAKSVKKEETFKNYLAFEVPLQLSRDQEKTVQFRYRLPSLRSPYRIKILPQNADITYGIKAEFPDFIKASRTVFHGQTAQPKTFRVPFSPVREKLKLVQAVLQDSGTLRISFSRTLLSSRSADLLNFSLRDLNTKNSEITDRIFIKAARVDGKIITLQMTGMTRQPGEEYEFVVRGVQDKNGNGLEGDEQTGVILSPWTLSLS